MIAVLVAFSILVIASSYFILVGNQAPTPTLAVYSAADKEKPKAETKVTTFDLGEMKVSDEKSGEFRIKNTGDKPLQLSKISSSCNCTFVQIIIDGKESDLFGMHSVSAFAGEIAPGKTAEVKVIYRPYIMPVYGVIEREGYIETNDPENRKLVFKVKANVK